MINTTITHAKSTIISKINNRTRKQYIYVFSKLIKINLYKYIYIIKKLLINISSV